MKPWKRNLIWVAVGYLAAKAPSLIPMLFHLAEQILNGLAQAVASMSHGSGHGG